MKNLWLKFLAIFIALFCRHLVTTDVKIATINVPIELQNIPNDLILVSDIEQLRVKLSGPRFLVSEIVSSSSPLVMRLPEGVTERVVLPIDLDGMQLPPSVSVLSVDPPELELNFDSKTEKLLGVVVPKLGQLSDDVQLLESNVVPRQVLVSGPRSELNRIKVIETFPVDLSTIQRSGTLKLNVRGLSKQMRAEIDSVSWLVQVKLITERRVLTLPVINPPEVVGNVTPQAVKVTFEGKRSRVREVGLHELSTGLEPSDIQGRYKVLVRHPDDLTLVSVTPEYISVVE